MGVKSINIKGLSWGHRRAMGPLVAASDCFGRLHPEIEVVWQERSLEAFEHQPIADAMEGVDFLVFDHPFCGAIEASRAFAPLDESLISLDGGSLKDEDYIGPSLSSYRYKESLWGLPIDGATNHAVYRSDLLVPLGVGAPRCWDDVLKLGIRAQERGLFLGMGAKSHHGLLALAALMANGKETGKGDEDLSWDDQVRRDFVNRSGTWETCKGALEQLMEFCPPESVNWTSIDLHEQMVARDDIVYCPIVYGYATYGEADQRRRLSFADMPGLNSEDCSGSVLGGAGIGLSANCNSPDEAYAFLRFLNAVETQRDIFTAHHGQPARIEAWNDPVIDKQFNGYFSGIRKSMETAWTRPRYDGYLKFQLDAGDALALGTL